MLQQARSWVRKAAACSGVADVGLADDLDQGVPPRLKSTSEWSAPAMRPEAPPAWTSLPASSSMCTRVMPTRRRLPSSSSTSRCPPMPRGRSYCEIW